MKVVKYSVDGLRFWEVWLSSYSCFFFFLLLHFLLRPFFLFFSSSFLPTFTLIMYCFSLLHPLPLSFLLIFSLPSSTFSYFCPLFILFLIVSLPLPPPPPPRSFFYIIFHIMYSPPFSPLSLPLLLLLLFLLFVVKMSIFFPACQNNFGYYSCDFSDCRCTCIADSLRLYLSNISCD